MARENIEAGSGLAQALAGFSKAVGDTRVQNAQNVSLGLQNMLNAMYRHRQDVKAEEQQRIDNNYREMAFAFDRSNKEKELKLKEQQRKDQAALVGAKASLYKQQARALGFDNDLHDKITKEYAGYEASTDSNEPNSQTQQLNVFDQNYNVTQNAPSDTKNNTQDSQVSKNPLLLAMSQAVVPAVTDGNKPNILFSSKGEVEQDLPPQNLPSPQNLASPQNQQTKKKTWGEFLLKRVQSGEPLSKQSQQDLAQYLAQNPIFNANVKTSSPNKETVSMQEMESLFASSEQILRGIRQYAGISGGIERGGDYLTRGILALEAPHQTWKNASAAFVNALARIRYGNQISKEKKDDIEAQYAIHKRAGGLQNALSILMHGLKEGIIRYEKSAEFADLKGFPVDSVERKRYENAKRNLRYLESLARTNNLKAFDEKQLSFTPLDSD